MRSDVKGRGEERSRSKRRSGKWNRENSKMMTNGQERREEVKRESEGGGREGMELSGGKGSG